MVKQYSYAKDKGIILSPHFAVGEFRSFNDATQRLTTDVVLIDDNLILTLEKIFTTLNCSKIIITSGYRDLSFEQYLGGNASGQHVKGTAADFICYDTNGREINPKLVCVTCEDLGLQGVGYMFGGTHIDVRGCKSWFDETQGCKAVNSWREYFGMVNPVVANNAPTSQPAPIPVSKPSVIYQVYTKNGGLPEVPNYNEVNSDGYAGIYGEAISGLRIRLSNGQTVYAQSHVNGCDWLGMISKCDNTPSGYSGWKDKPTDCVGIKADGVKLKYRVHTLGGQWLDWVNTFNIADSINGIAGIYGRTIDAIQIGVE